MKLVWRRVGKDGKSERRKVRKTESQGDSSERRNVDFLCIGKRKIIYKFFNLRADLQDRCVSG